MTDTSNTDTKLQAGHAATVRRQPWTTPSLRPLAASTAELGAGLTLDAEGHS
jgi:hypothetical protein